MIKRCVIVVFLHFLFAGSTGQGQRPDTPDTSIDTVMINRIIERRAVAWAKEKALQIDSVMSKEIIGRVDLDERPDGSVYAWIWKYRVIGRDTIYDNTIIKPVR